MDHDAADYEQILPAFARSAKRLPHDHPFQARPSDDAYPIHDFKSSYAWEMYPGPQHRQEELASYETEDFDFAARSARWLSASYNELDERFVDYPVADSWPESPGLEADAAPPPQWKRPLRMTCVGPSFQIGGVEQHTLSLAKFLDPARVRLTKCLVTCRERFHRPSAEAMPFPVKLCELGELSRETADCDVLLMWGEAFNDRLPSPRPLGVYLAHGESWWTRKGLEGSNRAIDHVIAVSRRVKQRVCAGFPTTTILNGVDSSRLGRTSSRDTIRQRFSFLTDDFVLGSVGRFTREKQTHLLIDAVSRLPKHFKLLLVGYGPRRNELLIRANELIPGRFAIVSACEFLGDWYGAMDAFSLVSEHEGFGLVIAEAMLCERPVIATHVGCVPEVIRDGVSGLVVAPRSEAIAAAARLLHAHPHWAKGLASEGRAFADAHLHAARMARQYESLFWRLMQTRGTAKSGGPS